MKSVARPPDAAGWRMPSKSGHLRPRMAGIRCITGPRDRGTFFTRAMEVGGMYVRSFNLTGESGIGFLADVD